MSIVANLIAELCPDGVPFRPLASLGRRNKGTAITAAKMKLLALSPGPVRVFAGGQTIADVAESDIPAKDVVREPSFIVKSRGHIGFSYYDAPSTHKSELWSYTITSPSAIQKFVYYYLLTQLPKLQNTARATSVKLPQLSIKDTDTLEIPVPPLPVQQEIVRILDMFTQLEARRYQYDYYRNALFADIDTSGEWRSLGLHGVSQRGSALQKIHLTDKGAPCFHYGEVYTHYGISAYETKSFVTEEFSVGKMVLQPGDLFIATTSENEEDLGKAVAWLGKTPAVASSDALTYRTDLDPRYVSHYFQVSTLINKSFDMLRERK